MAWAVPPGWTAAGRFAWAQKIGWVVMAGALTTKDRSSVTVAPLASERDRWSCALVVPWAGFTSSSITPLTRAKEVMKLLGFDVAIRLVGV